MTNTSQRRLDPTYKAARARFLATADEAGAEVASFAHPLRGLEGEELAVDVATLGARDAVKTLVIVSGTHGAEGYAGSALQSWWLSNRADQINPEVGVVLVHGLNPYGFSWIRRVTEDNVDLNRNFVDWAKPPANDGYDDIADILVPEAWDEVTIETTTTRLWEMAAEFGLPKFQEIVSKGQYTNPDGIFYGGTGPVWSARWLTEQLPDLVGSTQRLGILDLHTGLGPWGHGELISSDDQGDPGFERSVKWWGDVRSMGDGDSVSANLNGDWIMGVSDLLGERMEVTAVALEYGTVDTVNVLQALRADAWLHAGVDGPGPNPDRLEGATEIRAQVRAAFSDDDPAWLTKIIPRFDEVAAAALVNLAC